jgi:hypothetical protein
MKKKLWIFLALLILGNTPARAQTTVQCQASNGAWGPCQFLPPATLLSGVSATGAQASSAVSLPTFSTFGTLNITGASITGSPSGCSMALAYQAQTGSPNSSTAQTINFTPGNNFQQFAAGTTALPSADKMVATYSCTTYPTGGTISATFSPLTAVALASVGGAPISEGQAAMSASLPVAIASNQSNVPTNIAQVGGAAIAEGQAAMAASLPVAIASNQSAVSTSDAATSATGSAVPAKASYFGGDASGNLTGIITCDHWTPISLTANTQIITGASAKQTYVCSIAIVAAAATNVALVEGTGTTCATGTAGMAGGSTAATGWNFAANGGLTHGTGVGAIIRTATAADNVCLLVSAANQISGVITWTQF